MINPYSKLFRTPEKAKEDFEPVGGAMDCQTCYETVDFGRYYASEQLLIWKCSKGHISKSEGFSL